MFHTKKMLKRSAIAAVLVGAAFIAFSPIGRVAAAPPGDGARPLAYTLETLSDILTRLQDRLSSLRTPAGERLDEGLEQLIDLIADLLDQEGPSPDDGGLPVKVRIVRIDLRLHRLVHVLDGIVESADDTPERLAAREAVEELRAWIDGYIEGATSGMSPAEADRFEEAARSMIRSLTGEVIGIARRAEEAEGRPGLEWLVERLEDLLFRLDGFILRNFPPPAQEP